MTDRTAGQMAGPGTKTKGLGRMAVLGPVGILVLVFSSLVVNLFALAVPLVTLQVYDRILGFQSEATLQVLCAGILVIVLLDILLRINRARLIGWASARFEHAASTRALRQVMNADLQALDRFSPAELLYKLNAIAKMKSFYSGQSLINLIDLPFVFVFLGFIAYLAGDLVVVPAVLLVLFAIFAILLGRKIKKILVLRAADDNQRISFISEILENIHTVKMLGLESSLQRRYEALQGRNAHEAYSLSARNSQSVNAAALFTQMMMVAMISIGAWMVVEGRITMGILIACVLLSGRIMQPVQRSLSFWISFQEYRLARRKLNELFALPQLWKIDPDDIKTPRGKLEIQNLSFSYAERSSGPRFENVSLTLPPGKVVALGGPPGDGKTTLLKLIAGLYEPTRGEVLVDDVPVSGYPPAEIPRYVGYLPSEAEIFQGTIMDNLTGFRPEMEDQALEIARYLGIDRAVSKLSAGYETVLFDGPADPVTPGMKQCITIARVLVNRPRLVLFDFADKSLDKDGYNHLFRLLGQIKGQASMILASNDRNILHLAQEEYVIEGGRLVTTDHSRFSKADQVVQPLQDFRI